MKKLLHTQVEKNANSSKDTCLINSGLLLAVFIFAAHFSFAQRGERSSQAGTVGTDKGHPSEAVDLKLWKAEPFGSFEPGRELVEKRDAFAKHFTNDKGSITAHIGSGPIHYKEGGQWKTIYHSIVPSTSGFENLTNSHKTYYPATSAGAIKTILENGAALKDMLGMRMYYEVNGQAVQVQNIQSKSGSVNFNELTYAAAYGTGIDLKLTQNSTQRKMDYIIQSKAALGSIPAGAEYLIFEESVELPAGWKAELKDKVIYLLDAGGKVQASYEKPVFLDSPLGSDENTTVEETRNGNKPDADNKSEIKTGDYQITRNGSVVTIKTKVELSWLLASKRKFPVTIDPTVDFPTTNATYWAMAVASNGYEWGGSSWIRVGADACCYVRTGIKFDISSIPTTAIVNSVEGRVNYFAIYGSSPTTRTYEWRNSADPVGNAGTALYNSIITTYSGPLSPTGTAGWKGSAFNTTGIGAVQSNIGGFISCGMAPLGTFNASMAWDFRGYNHADRPLLRIDYTTCTNPTITSTATNETCTVDNNGSITNVNISGGLKVRYIRIKQNLTAAQDGWLHPAELKAFEIFTGTDVAYNKSATASGTPYGGGTTYDAAKLVDGNTGTIYHSGAPGETEWIEVDLGGEYNLDYIRIWSGNCCLPRFASLQLILKNGSGTVIHSRQIDMSVSPISSSFDYNVLDVSWADGATTLNRTGLDAGTYTLNYADVAGCFASHPKTISTANATPAAPAAASTQGFCVSATVANLAATGSNIKWYDIPNGGGALPSGNSLSTASYYASQTVNSCESPRTTVAVTIQADLPVANPGSIAPICYTGGPIALSGSVTNGEFVNWTSPNGSITGSGITGSFVTPNNQALNGQPSVTVYLNAKGLGPCVAQTDSKPITVTLTFPIAPSLSGKGQQ